jgi:hypothetical protein
MQSICFVVAHDNDILHNGKNIYETARGSTGTTMLPLPPG